MPKPTRVSIYPVLARAMWEKRISQAEIARSLGIHERSVGYKLKGISLFNIDEAIYINDKFFPEIPFRELFSEKKNTDIRILSKANKNKNGGEIMYMSSFGIPIVSKIEGGTFEDLKKSIAEKLSNIKISEYPSLQKEKAVG